MTTLGLFDVDMAERRKANGMARARGARREELRLARKIAFEVAMMRWPREVTFDDVARVLLPRGINLHNAAGSVFKSKEWEFTGKMVPSRRTSNNRRRIMVWRYVGE